MKKIKRGGCILITEDFIERREHFIRSVDWISVVPEKTDIDSLCGFMNSKGIIFKVRYMLNHLYCVIDKKSYYTFFDVYESTDLKLMCRFTRLDIKFDFTKPYLEIVERFKKQWNYSNGIYDKEGDATIYFNSRKSSLFCRFYDKAKELNLNTNLSRLEYEIKGYTINVFSERYKLFGLNDALNYLYETLCGFNFRKGLDTIVGTFEFDEPLSWDFLSRKSEKEKFRSFLKQYRHSILRYVDMLKDGSKFFALCQDMTDFDKILDDVI